MSARVEVALAKLGLVYRDVVAVVRERAEHDPLGAEAIALALIAAWIIRPLPTPEDVARHREGLD